MISWVASQGVSARILVTLLDVSESGYYSWRSRPPSMRSLRHSWLSQAILDIHQASGSTFGYRRIQRELGHRYGINVSHGTVEFLMDRAGIRGKAGRPHEQLRQRPIGVPSHRWVIDVQVFEAAKRHLYVAVILDTTSRRLVSWSTEGTADSTLAHRALDAAITQSVDANLSADAAHARILACSFTERAGLLGCAPLSGAKGDWYDHSVAERFWENIRGTLETRRPCPEPQDLRAGLLEIFKGFNAK
ncbi:IS3 family transposase [Streptomyces sp. NPDC005820]|uniref:IS3 family transposase n=1 Tax=Streptomyces sp. NPDC005820 TaxID=3157069 RepID=UPI0033FD8A86